MYSKNTLEFNRVTPSKAKNRTHILMKTYLAISVNHKSDYIASFYARNQSSITINPEQLE